MSQLLSSLQTLHLLLCRSRAVAREMGLGRGVECPEPPSSETQAPPPSQHKWETGFSKSRREQGLEVPQRCRSLLSCLLFKCFRQGAFFLRCLCKPLPETEDTAGQSTSLLKSPMASHFDSCLDFLLDYTLGFVLKIVCGGMCV